jgi:hypothetical protein
MKICLGLLCVLFLAACRPPDTLKASASLPGKINECSGVTTLDGQTLWIVEDGGNGDFLYGIGLDGGIKEKFEVANAKNKDWEALASDSLGNLYIGDFGNNQSRRKDLMIYKLPNPHKEKGDKIPAVQIDFRYPDQEAFPPPFANRRFDAEALFHFGHRLYIITKNQSDPFDGTAHVYSIPDSAGTYEARKELQFPTCGDRKSCRVTDAALSPDGNRLVLLGYGTLWVFEQFREKGFGTGPTHTMDVGASTQLEAVCFINNQLLYLADERVFRTGGNLYAFPLPPAPPPGAHRERTP